MENGKRSSAKQTQVHRFHLANAFMVTPATPDQQGSLNFSNNIK